MNDIAKRYLTTHDNPQTAITAFVQDLTRGDPATFKAGYSLESAILTAAESFDIPADAIRENLAAAIVEERNDDPEVYLVLGTVSAITKTVKGEIVETVEWLDNGRPDWSAYGICDPRGTSFEAFGDLVSALEHAERNYEFVFGEKPARLPD